MKKQFLLLAIGLTILSNINAVNAKSVSNFKRIPATEKAMKNFHKQYQNVSGEVWSQIENGYKANFVIDEHNTIAVYNNRGNWVYTIERFKADNLPVDLIERVKDEYDRFYIAGAEKISTPLSSIYIVHLENKTHFKTIKIDENGITVLSQFKKAQ